MKLAIEVNCKHRYCGNCDHLFRPETAACLGLKCTLFNQVLDATLYDRGIARCPECIKAEMSYDEGVVDERRN